MNKKQTFEHLYKIKITQISNFMFSNHDFDWFYQFTISKNFTPTNHYKGVNLYQIVRILYCNKIAGEWIIRQMCSGVNNSQTLGSHYFSNSFPRLRRNADWVGSVFAFSEGLFSVCNIFCTPTAAAKSAPLKICPRLSKD